MLCTIPFYTGNTHVLRKLDVMEQLPMFLILSVSVI